MTSFVPEAAVPVKLAQKTTPRLVSGFGSTPLVSAAPLVQQLVKFGK